MARAKSGSKSKTVKKAPSPASIIKKVETVSTSAKTLSKELKAMTKIFAENQKVLIAIKDMIDTVATSVEHVQKQSKHISSLEHDTEKLYNGLSQVRAQSGLVAKINSQTTRLQEKLKKIEDQNLEPKTEKLFHAVTDSFDSIKNNTTMIMKISDRIENLNHELQVSMAKSEAVSDIHQKADRLFQEIQGIKSVTTKSSSEASKDVLALLKLSEFQSNIRMQAESKYGEIKDLEKMASQTAEIINLFDKLSIELQEKIVRPAEVRQWAVSRILDCADRWEIRFTDVFNVLQNSLGRDLLKETIRIQQVRDIFGIRAVDEIRQELSIQTSSDAS